LKVILLIRANTFPLLHYTECLNCRRRRHSGQRGRN